MDHICWIDDTVCEECAVEYVPLDEVDMVELDNGLTLVVDREDA